ncbi:5,6-dimethylbenzimidazole synthase [Magnetofaba australis]|uniref:Putative cob(II)yrinic acid a,c-diamide reductase n=1 Tax=Magnetofaba australis IT-1 TaxID=1434232 RepID=A0A1Y2K2V3_9PROT|nr:5,6-dimethylbenzimidazole synthase [Magnetofaba australis]OSM02302.1 putative cob(II)yrinic acid a,c-diamide reductase [Magnetofaba australis IT-1]
MDEPTFDAVAREAIYEVIAARRDIRHFLPDQRVEPATLARILTAAHQAPSVGLMQPWRFIRICNPATRAQLAEAVETERLRTAEALSERQTEFLRLKIEGIRECAELLALIMAPDDGTVLGRRTMPREMAIASCACAAQNLWLAARAENLGLGWVSFFDPDYVTQLLGCPPGAFPLGIFCLGPVREFPAKPLLEMVDWRHGEALEALLYTDAYGHGARGEEVALAQDHKRAY